MPDGAIIHRRLIEDFNEQEHQKLKVIPDEKVFVDIRFLNNTFQEMFTGYKETLRQQKILQREKKKDLLTKMKEERKEGYA